MATYLKHRAGIAELAKTITDGFAKGAPNSLHMGVTKIGPTTIRLVYRGRGNYDISDQNEKSVPKTKFLTSISTFFKSGQFLGVRPLDAEETEAFTALEEYAATPYLWINLAEHDPTARIAGTAREPLAFIGVKDDAAAMAARSGPMGTFLKDMVPDRND